MSNKLKKSLFLSACFGALFLLLPQEKFYAADCSTTGECFSIPSNNVQANYTAHSICYTVRNNSGSAIVAPYKTQAEWTKFGSASLTGVTKTSCSLSCTTPWGTTVANGASVTAYLDNLGTPTCTSQTRTCTSGTLSGTYTEQTCAAGCNLPWGGYTLSGTSVTAYQAATGSPCASQTRSCTNGTLSGTYTFQTCGNSCTAPWGATVAHGASVTAYSSTAGQPWNGTPCSSKDQTRTCNNGTLSGTYTNQTCNDGCTVTLTNPLTGVDSNSNLTHGGTVTAYSSGTAADCTTIDQVRTCTNGTMSGSNSYSSCRNCPGTMYGGYCFVYGDRGVSCDSACSTVSRVCDLTGLAWSNTSNTQCQNVATALGVYTGWNGSTTGSSGCYRDMNSAGNATERHSGTPTCEAGTGSDNRRYCSCL